LRNAGEDHKADVEIGHFAFSPRRRDGGYAAVIIARREDVGNGSSPDVAKSGLRCAWHPSLVQGGRKMAHPARMKLGAAMLLPGLYNFCRPSRGDFNTITDE
jgi:hypothetical protein